MDNFVDNHFLLPKITFGDFSGDEISRFFRLERAGFSNVKTNMATIDDDNPFLEHKESNSSLTDKVDSLHLTKSSSFPSLSTNNSLDIKFIGASNTNTNKNNPGTSKDSQVPPKSPRPGTSTGAGGNPFATTDDDDIMMDIEDSNNQVGLNNLSIIVSQKTKQTPGSKPKIVSKSPAPHLGSPISVKRLTRASAKLPSADYSGVVLRSKSRTKSTNSDPNKRLKQSISNLNLFNLDDLNLTQLVSTQSETNALKLTIKRKSLADSDPATLRSFSDTNLFKKVKTSSVASVGQTEPNVLSETFTLPKQTTSSSAGLGSTSSPTSSDPKPQRTSPKHHRRFSVARQHSSAVSVGSDHVGTDRLDLPNRTITETPSSSVLNRRLSLTTSPELINSDSSIDLLSKLRESVDNIRFEPVPQASTSSNVVNLSQQLTVRFNDNNRQVTMQNSVSNKSKKSLNPKEVKTWDFYQKSKDINPFDIPEQEDVQIIGGSSHPPINHATSNTNLSKMSNSSVPFKQVPNSKKIFKPAQSILDDYQTSLAKEMTLRLHVNMLDVQLSSQMFPNWAVSYNPPPTLINTQQKAEDLVAIRKELAIMMMRANRDFYKRMLEETLQSNDSLESSLRAIYREKVAVGFDIKHALDSAAEFATNAKANKYEELNVIMTAIRSAPEAALWLGISNDFDRPPRAQKSTSTSAASRPPALKSPKQGPRTGNQNQNGQNRRNQNQTSNPGTSAPRKPRSKSRSPYKNYYRPRSTSKGPKKSTKRRHDDLAARIGTAVQAVLKDII